MSDLPPNLEQLDAELLAMGEGAMLLDELDGFVAGLLVCPEIILPGEWMPMVVNRFGADQAGFDDIDHANRALGLVRQHHNSVATLLIEDPEEVGPPLSFDSHDDRVVCELWIDGFESAVGLRPECWQDFLDADADAGTATAIRGMLALGDAACCEQVLPEADYAALDATQRAISPAGSSRSMPGGPPIVRQDRVSIREGTRPALKKIGRNDPCPCGSGKKHKKCCGLNERILCLRRSGACDRPWNEPLRQDKPDCGTFPIVRKRGGHENWVA